MKRMMMTALALLLCLTLAGTAVAEAVDGPTTWYYDGAYYENTLTEPQTAKTLMRVSSRSGPGTNYDELGSYYKAGYTLTVLSRAYDDRNGIWWLQVELSYGSELRRMYTGLKRVDIDINTVQDEYQMYFATVISSNIPYYGPGTQYTAHKETVPAGTDGIIYGMENGWVQLEFYNEAKKQYRRVWMPIERVQIYDYVTY